MIKKILLTLLFVFCGISVSMAQHGYRGFIEVAGGCSFAETSGYSAAVSTTHGYQFNGHFFTGAGVQLGRDNSDTDYDDYVGLILSFYGQIRYDYSLTHKWSAYGACRLGYACGDYIESFYCAPEVGLRFSSHKLPVAFNIGIRGDLYDKVSSVKLSLGLEF